MSIIRTTVKGAEQFIAERRPFIASSLSGSDKTDWISGHGLTRYWHEILIAGMPVIDYVVYSYKTPIAWHTTDGDWIVVETRFSQTTTRHQSVVRRAVSGVTA